MTENEAKTVQETASSYRVIFSMRFSSLSRKLLTNKNQECSESSSADSIGEKVRALNVEMPMEKRIVAANCL